MVNVIIICVTCVVVTAILSQADITINIKRSNMTPTYAVNNEDKGISQEELDKIYQREAPPNFDEVIKAINQEFGGITYEE